MVIITSNQGPSNAYDIFNQATSGNFSPLPLFVIRFSSTDNDRIASGGGGPVGSILASDTWAIRPPSPAIAAIPHTGTGRDIHCAS